MEKQQNSHKQNFANRIENYNQNNNYQHHNRNHYGAGTTISSISPNDCFSLV